MQPMNSVFDKFGVKELKCPAQSPNLKPNEHHCGKLQYWLHPWYPHTCPTSVPGFVFLEEKAFVCCLYIT